MMGSSHHIGGILFTAAGTKIVGDAVGLNVEPHDILIASVIGMVAGVLPDIDHDSSNITKGKIPLFRYMGRRLGPLVAQLFSIPPRIVGVGVRATGNHRGPTHSLPFALLWTVLAAPLYALFFVLLSFLFNFLLGALSFLVFEPVFGRSVSLPVDKFVDWLVHGLPIVMPLVMISVFLGYVSHLVLDGMTKVPIPLLWPVKRRFFLLPKPFRVQTEGAAEVQLIRPILALIATYFVFVNALIPMAQHGFDMGKQESQKVSKQVKKTKAKLKVDR